MWRKDEYELNLHPSFNIYKRWQEWSIYQIFTTVFWRLSLDPGSAFSLKKEDTEENSEDASEGDPLENTAGEQSWRGTKR
jgi:hypothetical protein